MPDRWHPQHKRGLVVEIPASLYHEVNRERGHLGQWDRPASFKQTVSLLLQAGGCDSVPIQ